MMDNYNLKEDEAKRAVKRKDEMRTRFLSFFSDERYQDDPLLYDMVLNMDRISFDRAEELIVNMISQM